MFSFKCFYNLKPISIKIKTIFIDVLVCSSKYIISMKICTHKSFLVGMRHHRLYHFKHWELKLSTKRKQCIKGETQPAAVCFALRHRQTTPQTTHACTSHHSFIMLVFHYMKCKFNQDVKLKAGGRAAGRWAWKLRSDVSREVKLGKKWDSYTTSIDRNSCLVDEPVG